MATIDIDLFDCDDEELIFELESRGYIVTQDGEESDEDEDDDDSYVLNKNFDSIQLRDHLLDIAGCGHHTADKELLNIIKNKLERL